MGNLITMTKTKLTVAQAKEALTADPNPDLITQLKEDSRKGIQRLLESFEKRQAKLAAEKAKFQRRLQLERSFWSSGINYVAGIDEVGRGPLAGPVVAAAVILPHDFDLFEVNDSKQLTPHKRAQLYDKILDRALAVAVGVASNKVIDEINIYQATRKAMKQSVANLQIRPQQLLIDAMDIDCNIPQKKLIKGDAKSASISAASIVAKVNRDHLMDFYDQIYPGYDFHSNAGYGTKEHLQALSMQGISPIHRVTFEPIKSKYV